MTPLHRGSRVIGFGTFDRPSGRYRSYRRRPRGLVSLWKNLRLVVLGTESLPVDPRCSLNDDGLVMVEQMNSSGSFGVSEVARRLGVGEQQVRVWIREGRLVASRVGRTFLVRPSDLDAFERSGRPPKGRVFSPANAWALLLLAAGEPVAWLPPKQRWDLRQHLASHDLADLAPRLRERASVRRLYAHPAAIKRLLDWPGVMRSGVSAAGLLNLGLIGGEDEADVYASPAVAARLERGFQMRPSPQANVVLRVVPDGALPIERTVAPWSAVALDLMEHADPRARQVGRELLRHTT